MRAAREAASRSRGWGIGNCHRSYLNLQCIAPRELTRFLSSHLQSGRYSHISGLRCVGPKADPSGRPARYKDVGRTLNSQLEAPKPKLYNQSPVSPEAVNPETKTLIEALNNSSKNPKSSKSLNPRKPPDDPQTPLGHNSQSPTSAGEAVTPGGSRGSPALPGTMQERAGRILLGSRDRV